MSELKKKKLGLNEEIIRVDSETLLDDLPIGAVLPPDKITMVIKPKKTPAPYGQLILLFVCAIISIGCDAFIFSSSLFGDIYGDFDNVFTTVVCFLCLVVHIIPEVVWGVILYKKFGRVANYAIYVTTEKLIACGKGAISECKVIRLEDLTDLTCKNGKVTLITPMDKLVIEVEDANALYADIKNLYDNL